MKKERSSTDSNGLDYSVQKVQARSKAEEIRIKKEVDMESKPVNKDVPQALSKEATSNSGTSDSPQESTVVSNAAVKQTPQNNNLLQINNEHKKNSSMLVTLDLSNKSIKTDVQAPTSSSAKSKPSTPSNQPEGPGILISDFIEEVVKNSLGITPPTTKDSNDGRQRRIDAIADTMLTAPASIKSSDSVSTISSKLQSETKPASEDQAIPVSWAEEPANGSEAEIVEVDSVTAMSACRVLLTPFEYARIEACKSPSSKSENPETVSAAKPTEQGTNKSNEQQSSNAQSDLPNNSTKVTMKRKFDMSFSTTESGVLDMSKKSFDAASAASVAASSALSADSDVSNSPKRLKIVESE